MSAEDAAEPQTVAGAGCQPRCAGGVLLHPAKAKASTTETNAGVGVNNKL